MRSPDATRTRSPFSKRKRDCHDPGLDFLQALFGKLDGIETLHRMMKLLTVDDDSGMERERGRWKRACGAVYVSRSNEGVGMVAKQQTGDGELYALTDCSFANAMIDRAQLAD